MGKTASSFEQPVKVNPKIIAAAAAWRRWSLFFMAFGFMGYLIVVLIQ
jgi:hypothetical protein